MNYKALIQIVFICLLKVQIIKKFNFDVDLVFC